MNANNLNVLRTELKKDPEALGYAEMGSDYPAIAARLNRSETIENAEPQLLIPKRLDLINDLFAIIQPAEAFALLNVPGLLDRVERAVERNHRPAMRALFVIIGSQLTPESRQAIAAKLEQTEPDPNWQPTVQSSSRAERLGLRVVSEHDVQAAMT